MLRIADAFHTGFVVEDLESAKDELSEQFAVTWTAVEDRDLTLRGQGGVTRVQLRFTYTTEGPHRLELLEAVPGTVWEPAGPGLHGPITAHHIGVWCDDLVDCSGAMAAAGAPLLATYAGAGLHPVGFAYHRLESGLLVELVDAARRPAFERWFAGGPFPAAGAAA